MRTVIAAGIEARWFAGPDGIGHAVLRGPGVTRTACGRPRLPARLEHPIRERCRDCDRLVEGPEGEQRALWGNR